MQLPSTSRSCCISQSMLWNIYNCSRQNRLLLTPYSVYAFHYYHRPCTTRTRSPRFSGKVHVDKRKRFAIDFCISKIFNFQHYFCLLFIQHPCPFCSQKNVIACNMNQKKMFSLDESCMRWIFPFLLGLKVLFLAFFLCGAHKIADVSQCPRQSQMLCGTWKPEIMLNVGELLCLSYSFE